MKNIISPLNSALISKNNATAAKNYDEFQSDKEITEILQANPASILRADMPHAHPKAQGIKADSQEALNFAAGELAAMKAEGLLSEENNFYYVYRIDLATRPNRPQIGLGAMVSGDIHDSVKNPGGLIIRNEAIFEDKARGRAAMIKHLKAMVGCVNLCTDDSSKEIENFLLASSSGIADVSCTDESGNIHSVFLLRSGFEVIEKHFASKEFYVADGNHRSFAASLAGYSRFLAVVFCLDTMNIDPYHRLIKLPAADADLIGKIKLAGFTLEDAPQPGDFYSPVKHEIGFYHKGRWQILRPLNVNETDPVESCDSRLIENRIIKGILGLDPADKHIAYVGADYSVEYLRKKTDDGSFDMAFSVPAMSMRDFGDLNRQRKMLPRKTTWFTPKVRSGLVVGLPQ